MAAIQIEALKWIPRVWTTNISIVGNVYSSSHLLCRLIGLALFRIVLWSMNGTVRAVHQMYWSYELMNRPWV
jgi:hypothetical protein